MKRKRGFGLVDTVLASVVMGLVMAGAAGITVNIIRSFNWTNAQVDADRTATQAMQWVNRDLQDAKQVDVQSATSILIYYPQVAGDGTYIRSALDTINTIQYYRGNSNGTANPAGPYLFRKPAGGSPRAVCKNLFDLVFTSTNPASLDITLKTTKTGGSANTKCDMVHRAIFLRNY